LILYGKRLSYKCCHSPPQTFFHIWSNITLFGSRLNVFLLIFCHFVRWKVDVLAKTLQGLKLRNNSHTFRHLEMHPNWILGEFGKLHRKPKEWHTIVLFCFFVSSVLVVLLVILYIDSTTLSFFISSKHASFDSLQIFGITSLSQVGWLLVLINNKQISRKPIQGVIRLYSIYIQQRQHQQQRQQHVNYPRITTMNITRFQPSIHHVTVLLCVFAGIVYSNIYILYKVKAHNLLKKVMNDEIVRWIRPNIQILVPDRSCFAQKTINVLFCSSTQRNEMSYKELEK